MKKKTKIILAIIICVALIMGCIGTWAYNKYLKIDAKETVKLSELTDADDITLTAHRGLSALAPENSLPAIELAGENGYKYVEFDIHMTKDGVWVLNHDEHIFRMTDGFGYIKDYTYSEITEFTVNNGANHQDYPDMKFPTLDQALETCSKYDIIPMIEIKNYTDDGIKTLVDSISEYGYENSCYVISFIYDAIKAVQQANGNIDVLYLIEELDEAHIAQCLENPEWGVSFKALPKTNTEVQLKQLQQSGRELFCWTVDQGEYIDFYYPLGVKNFVTNRILP